MAAGAWAAAAAFAEQQQGSADGSTRRLERHQSTGPAGTLVDSTSGAGGCGPDDAQRLAVRPASWDKPESVPEFAFGRLSPQ